MMLLFRISVQLSVEHLIAHAVCNFQNARAIASVLLYNNSRIQLDCFDRSAYSQCALCNRTWLKFRKAFCFFSSRLWAML